MVITNFDIDMIAELARANALDVLNDVAKPILQPPRGAITQ